MKKTPHDIIGNIAILKFPKQTKKSEKIKVAKKFLKQKNIKTILEKTEKIKGRLRKPQTKFLAGEKTKQTIHTESGCKFLLNIDETYFSPRLSNERKIIADEIAKKTTKTKNKILVMFAGVAPFPVIIGKKLKQKKKKAEIISNEINKKANTYAERNIKLNKLQDCIKVIPGDSKKLPAKLKKYKADFIIMPRPNLPATFLPTTLKLSHPRTQIYYYGFGEKQKVLEKIKKDCGKKIGKIKIRKAGEIAPYKFRWLCKFKIN